jgi:hypothetical protein
VQQSFEKWQAMQSKYRLEDAQTAPMVSLIANDNWVEFTLRYVVTYKMRSATKTELFTRILKAVESTNGNIKFASTTFQLVEGPDVKVKMKI